MTAKLSDLKIARLVDALEDEVYRRVPGLDELEEIMMAVTKELYKRYLSGGAGGAAEEFIGSLATEVKWQGEKRHDC